MKFSKEIAEVVNAPKTLEELVDSAGKTMVLYVDVLESSHANTTVSPARKLHPHGPLYDRTNDTLTWDSTVRALVFSSDDAVARCPVYANSNDSIADWNIDSPYFMVLRNAKAE